MTITTKTNIIQQDKNKTKQNLLRRAPVTDKTKPDQRGATMNREEQQLSPPDRAGQEKHALPGSKSCPGIEKSTTLSSTHYTILYYYYIASTHEYTTALASCCTTKTQ